MPELPSGTVTFLFSDIEGSTRMLQEHADAWPALLERHREILRACFSAEGGVEVGTEGDSFFVAFPTARGAVTAAAAAQRALSDERWPAGAEVRVRMGMHTGEASFSARTYAGLNVHRASRIAGVSRGGQVLLSDATRTLLADDLPEGFALRDLGQHRLRDLDRPEHLFQLVVPGLPSEFPPIASADSIPNNLPTRLTTFLGRENEIEEVSQLLAGGSRLLTLTGPGGTGKTSLSLEVALRTLEAYPDGVFFVELAPISQTELVAPTIARALGLPDRGGRTPEERISGHIADGRMLLVLDNFEQVSDAAPVVTRLLAGCPNLVVLASSRAALHVSGEQEYPVPPLGLPDPANLPPLAQLSQYEAVALFIERARAVKPSFEVTNENAPAVAEICVRLDGLPLALELAAARIRILTPQAMLSRLEHRLGLLAGGSRDLPERQQTLRGAIAWSHDMLEEPDRALFACLSVFVGGAGLEAIERVCGPEVAGDLLDGLSSLVEKSLVRQAESVTGEPRFGMLETIREFAVEQAIERGWWDELRNRHAELFVAVAEEAARHVMGPDKRLWLDRLAEDHDNLRAAMSRSVETEDAASAMRIGFALWRFWQMRGYLMEGLERVEASLAMPSSQDHPRERADALSAAAGLAYWQADSVRSRMHYQDEIAARSALGDRRGLAEALYGIAFTWAIIELRDPATVRQASESVNAAREIFRELADESGIGRCEWALANILWGSDRLPEARDHALHALEVFERLGEEFMVGWSNYTLGLAALAAHHLEPSDAELDEAEMRFKRALRIFREADDITGYALVIDGLAAMAHGRGDRERAARLSGAVAMLERRSGTGLNLWNRDTLGFDPTKLRTDPEVSAAYEAGEALSTPEAVAYALGEPG